MRKIDQLNPTVLAEVKRLEVRLGIVVEPSFRPPNIDDMETYITCRNQAEWDSSFHLTLAFDDNVGVFELHKITAFLLAAAF